MGTNENDAKVKARLALCREKVRAADAALRDRQITWKHRCQRCGKDFRTDQEWELHDLECPHTCGICYKQFSSKGKFRVHVQDCVKNGPKLPLQPHAVDHNPIHGRRFEPPVY